MAGRPEEAVALVEKAMRLDPHYSPIYAWVLGLAYFASPADREPATA